MCPAVSLGYGNPVCLWDRSGCECAYGGGGGREKSKTDLLA